MTYFTFERRRFGRGEQAFDGDTLLGEVVERKPWRERLSLNQRPPRYLAKLPSGSRLPVTFAARHEAAEALLRTRLPSRP